MSNPSSERVPSICPRCSASVSPDAPEGLCPRCVAAGNFLAGSFLAAPPAPASPPPAEPPKPEEIAAHFPQLDVEALLGRGGMGVVYRARQKSLDRRVALKLLAPERADDPAFAARFAAEAQALARLHHPHIVTVYDFGRAGGFYYLLMEFVDGLNLRQLQQAGRLAAAEALAIVPQICEALQFAHERGVVHRDIKPENILVDREGRVKVADFGLARLVATEPAAAAETAEGDLVMGTPGYMAPEQRTHPDQVDHRADIYALGAVFYEMLTGRRPESPIATPSKQVLIDVRLDEVVLRALEKEPSRRWQQAGEVKTRLETIAATSPEKPAGGGGRKTTTVLAAALGLAVIGGLVAWRVWPRPAPAAAAPVAATPPERPDSGEVVNLSSHYTPRKLGEKSLVRALETIEGAATFDGLRFQVDGQITLAGDAFKDFNPKESYPAAVKDIALGGRRFDELHLLHVTYWENPHGEPVATLRLRYADGGVAEFPLRYGVEVRDWSRRNSEEHERLEDSNSKIVKRDLKRNQHQATTRITKTRLMNPRPGEPVLSMEIEAAPGLASYSLLAATTATRDPRRETTPAVAYDEAEEEFKGEMLIRVVDRASGQPVSGGLIKTGGNFSGANVVAEPLRVNEHGEARLRFPSDQRVKTFSLNLSLVTAGGREAWLSWDRDYPRVAYFMVGGEAGDERGMAKLDTGLPEWRKKIARDLLAELGRNAITPTLPDWRGRISMNDERAFDDLGALMQGTHGAVLFKAAKAQSGGPEGTEFQNLESRDPGAYKTLHGPRIAAKKAFLEWVWAQVAPDAKPLPQWTLEKATRPATFRPLSEAELRPLLEAVKTAARPTGQAPVAPDPEEGDYRLAVDALLARLRGTAIDHWIESSSQLRIGEEPAFGPSARTVELIDARLALLSERGATEEIRLRLQERREAKRMVSSMLSSAMDGGELANLLAAAEKP